MIVQETIKTAGDIAALTITIGTLVQWLPAAAAALTIIWTALRIYEWVANRLKERNEKQKDTSTL